MISSRKLYLKAGSGPNTKFFRIVRAAGYHNDKLRIQTQIQNSKS